MAISTSKIGAAGVHMVCANLLLAGIGTSIAAEGESYDLIADTGDRLIRIQVKACTRARKRGSRSALPAYQFCVTKNHRPNIRGEVNIKHYDSSMIDMLAFVAIDTGTIAFIPMQRKIQQILWLYMADAPKMVRAGREMRRRIDEFPLHRALMLLRNPMPGVSTNIFPPAGDTDD